MLEWDEPLLVVRDQRFITVEPGPFLNVLRDADSWTENMPMPPPPPASAPDVPTIMVWKSRAMVERLAALVEELQPRRIVELGIATGGSVALLGALAPEAKVVAIEINEDPSPFLARHIDYWDLGARLRPYFGVDQADRRRLAQILADEFGGEPIDLVIDDASHRLAESRISLEVLYPRMRPGGCYVIEDWDWAHFDLSAVPPGIPIPGGPPLTVLICELLMARGTGNGLVDHIEVDETVRVWRGPAALDPDTWSLRDSFITSAPVLAEQPLSEQPVSEQAVSER